MPDIIDIDIPGPCRPEFIRYVRDRYGSQNTLHRLSLIRPLEQNRQFVMFSNVMARSRVRELTNITKKSVSRYANDGS